MRTCFFRSSYRGGRRLGFILSFAATGPKEISYLLVLRRWLGVLLLRLLASTATNITGQLAGIRTKAIQSSQMPFLDTLMLLKFFSQPPIYIRYILVVFTMVF